MPIIVVPGIMGTRLVRSSSWRPAWDPDPRSWLSKAWSAVTADWPILGDLARKLEPARQAGRELRAAPAAVRQVYGVAGLVWPAYDRLVTGLVDPRLAAACPGGIRVYAAGYDWRKSNLESAATLQATVERALEETRASRVIIVAHSMGGLVARAFCRGKLGDRPAEEVVERLILLGSPTHGSPQAYRMLRQSWVPADDLADIDLGPLAPHEGLLVSLPAGYVRRFPSLHQLLPSAAFCRAHPDWVRFDRSSTSLPDASDPDRLYADPYTGVGTPGAALRAMLLHRRVFDDHVGGYLPARTTVVYSSGHDTETRYRITRWGGLDRAGRPTDNRGDDTVPTFSGAAMGIGRRVPGHDLSRLDHGGLANAPEAVRCVQQIVREVCARAHAGGRDPGSLARRTRGVVTAARG